MKETCEYCAGVFPISVGWHDWPSWTQDEDKIRIDFRSDPFNDEIRHDDSLHWICSNCYYQSWMEI